MYALLKPDGSFHRVVNEDLPGGSTDYAAFGVLPVNDVVPEGYYRNGWQIVNGVCEPVLVEIPPPPAPTVPWAISNADLRRQLVLRGINPALILGYLNSLEEGAAKWLAIADWEFANYFERSHPMLNQLAPSFGLTVEDVDAMFLACPPYPRML